jgi:hypothetical protein
MNNEKPSLRGTKQSHINSTDAKRECQAALAMTFIVTLLFSSSAYSGEFSGYIGGQAGAFFA